MLGKNASYAILDDIASFNTYDYPIGGKLVVGRVIISEQYKQLIEDGNTEAKLKVKSDLIHQMATYMLENNLVEFTHYDNPSDFTRSIAVRAYLAPDAQIKILRMANKI